MEERKDFDAQVANVGVAAIDLALSSQGYPPVASLAYGTASVFSHPIVAKFFNRKRMAHFNAINGVTADDVKQFNKSIEPYTEDFWANELRHLESLQAVEKAELTGHLLKATLQMKLNLDIYLSLCGIVERVPLLALYELKKSYLHTITLQRKPHGPVVDPRDEWEKQKNATPFLIREGLLVEEQSVVPDRQKNMVTAEKDPLYKLETKESLSKLGEDLLRHGFL